MIRTGQFFRYGCSGIVLEIIGALAGDPCSAGDRAAAEAVTNYKVPVYPVQKSANNRYLIDQNNMPFMIVGDSPHSLIGRMSKSDAQFYMANRQRYGINTLWVELLCNNKTACNEDGTTFDGIAPFTTPGDISTPNPAYFHRVDDMLQLAAAHGIMLLLDALETTGWLATFKANGPEKAAAFGRFLGDRYKDVPNFVWMYGNDFQTWADAIDDAAVLAVARGIKDADPHHIHTTELNYLSSGSLDDGRWDHIVDLDGAYSYYDTPGVIQFSYMKNLFAPRRWYELVPDQAHAVVTDGYGKPASLGTGSITTDTYLTAARTSDGALVIAYMPTIRMISVDMSTLSAGVKARWYDPTIGKFIDVSGSPFPNTGTRVFKPPSKNHDGDGDWVLVLEAE